MLERTVFIQLASRDYSRLSSALAVFCGFLLNEITSTSENNVHLSNIDIAEVLPCSSFIPNTGKFKDHE